MLLTKQRNIYEQQAYNKRLTLFVMFLFILFLSFLGFGFDFFFGVEAETYFPFGTLAALTIASVSAIWSLNNGAAAVLGSSGAVPVDENDPRYRQLVNVVEEMCLASGLPKPKVYVIPDEDPNAFATGKDPASSAIAITTGLLEKLNREELQAVVAHEVSHIRNYDIRLMTVIAALVGAILLLSDWAARLLRFGGKRGGRRDSKGGGVLPLIVLVLWIVSIVLAPLVSRLLAMAVSRKREYIADASAAELTRNPLALANALRKLENATAPTASIKKGTAHLCIVDPLGKELNSKEGFVAELFGTHPPIEKRVAVLHAMAYQYQTASAPTPSA